MARTVVTKALLVTALLTPVALADGLGPTPYLSFNDSPFNGLGFANFYLEDFEDGALSTPGVTASGGIVGNPSPQTDSVDADNGVIDGSGTAGHSWFSNGAVNTFTFTFDAATLGALPTHAGLVWTDVGLAQPTIGVGDVSFEAFGPGGVSLGTLGPVTLGDGAVTGATAEDRFFGWIDAGGISSITISMPQSTDWEVDHVQYGIVPEPAGAAAALIALLAVRRR